MAMRRSLAGKIASLALVALQSAAVLLFAAPSGLVTPAPAPGTYPEPILVRVSSPEGTRVELSVNGEPFAPATAPIALSAPVGEERDYSVKARVYPLEPETSPIGEERWHWRVDRKAPAPPALTARALPGGTEIVAAMTEPGSLKYRMWHPSAKASASGFFLQDASLFVPYGASVVVWAEDAAGNASDPVSPSLIDYPEPPKPFRILNPIAGVWANRQTLVIESGAAAEIRYSLDGSDPAVTGLAYDGPVPLDGTGAKTLRVTALDASGKRRSESVSFSVEDGVSPPPGFSDLSPASGSAEFSEIAIPEGYDWSFGEGESLAAGGRTIAVAAVRGAMRRYAINLSSGAHRWRYLTESGNAPVSDKPAAPPASGGADTNTEPPENEPASPIVSAARDEATVPTAQEGAPVVRVHDWNFVSFAYRDPVYWSLDGATWHLYGEPVFVDRSADALLRWYSSSWKTGTTQKLRLPAKPRLVGVNPGAVVAEPVFLRASASPMTFRYTVGSEYLPPKPIAASPELASGLLLEVPSLAEASFIVRVLAEYDGIEQGELVTWVTVDRNPPPAPATGLESAPKWSRLPLRFAPLGDGAVEVSIDPPLFTRSGNGWILTGSAGKAIEYTVSARSVDRAGNASGTAVSRVTVELDTAYVATDSPDGSVPSSRDGSPQAPFASLDDALALAGAGKNSFRIIARGTVPLSGVARITGNVSIQGNGSTIAATERALLSVVGGSLYLSGCSIRQEVLSGDEGPFVRAGKPSALIEVSDGSLTANGVEVTVSGGLSACALRASLSRVACESSRFAVAAKDYGQALEIADSTLSLVDSKLSCEAQTVSVLGLARSRARIAGSTVTAIPRIAGRAVEAWDSAVDLSGASFERMDSVTAKRVSNGDKNRDTALWLDSKSVVTKSKGFASGGFWREIERERQ
jgi:hypothetical protein